MQAAQSLLARYVQAEVAQAQAIVAVCPEADIILNVSENHGKSVMSEFGRNFRTDTIKQKSQAGWLSPSLLS